VRDFLVDAMLQDLRFALSLEALLCVCATQPTLRHVAENVMAVITQPLPKRGGGSAVHAAAQEGNGGYNPDAAKEGAFRDAADDVGDSGDGGSGVGGAALREALRAVRTLGSNAALERWPSFFLWGEREGSRIPTLRTMVGLRVRSGGRLRHCTACQSFQQGESKSGSIVPRRPWQH
jgi:hypothetical protein